MSKSGGEGRVWRHHALTCLHGSRHQVGSYRFLRVCREWKVIFSVTLPSNVSLWTAFVKKRHRCFPSCRDIFETKYSNSATRSRGRRSDASWALRHCVVARRPMCDQLLHRGYCRVILFFILSVGLSEIIKELWWIWIIFVVSKRTKYQHASTAGLRMCRNSIACYVFLLPCQTVVT